MIPTLQTARLLLRPFDDSHAEGLFALDQSEAVLKYLQGKPMTDIRQANDVIGNIQAQYKRNGIGRWAVIREADRRFLGWCGIKKVDDAVTNGRTNYYDIGYRFLPEFWRKGYAFEAAAASLQYAFQDLHVQEVHATVMMGNVASARIAEKLGMHLTETFIENDRQWYWYTIQHTPAGVR